jgi:hypothetical protein
MIIETLLAGLLGILQDLFTAVLPAAGTLNLSASGAWAAGYSWIDSMMPVHEALSVGVVLVGIYGATFALRTFLTLWAVVRG